MYILVLHNCHEVWYVATMLRVRLYWTFALVFNISELSVESSCYSPVLKGL